MAGGEWSLGRGHQRAHFLPFRDGEVLRPPIILPSTLCRHGGNSAREGEYGWCLCIRNQAIEN
jgi:hypothetical protein